MSQVNHTHESGGYSEVMAGLGGTVFSLIAEAYIWWCSLNHLRVKLRYLELENMHF